MYDDDKIKYEEESEEYDEVGEIATDGERRK